MDKRATPPVRVTSPTWGPPPPCKQALGVTRDRTLVIPNIKTVIVCQKLYPRQEDLW